MASNVVIHAARGAALGALLDHLRPRGLPSVCSCGQVVSGHGTPTILEHEAEVVVDALAELGFLREP
jgi:hypothetical protein